MKRRVRDVQRNSTVQEREKSQYAATIAKIEAAALGSFQKNDLNRDPSRFAELANVSSQALDRLTKTGESSSRLEGGNRFGEATDDDHLLAGKKQNALESVAKSLEVKNRWIQAKNAEGQIYYWHRESLETKFEPPKTGFLSLEEQGYIDTTTTTAPSTSTADDKTDVPKVYKHQPYGAWKETETAADANTIVDLQLPNQDLGQIMIELEEQKRLEEAQKVDEEEDKKPLAFEFKEKTANDLKRSLVGKNETVSFKKRANVRRNIRGRDDDD